MEPVVVSIKTIIKASVKKKQQNKQYYDNVSKPLPPLVVGENIRSKIKPSSPPCWSRGGSVVSNYNDRFYVTETNGRQYRRHRFHIRKARELVTPKSNNLNHPADYKILPQGDIPSTDVQASPQRVEPPKSTPKPHNLHKPPNVPIPQIPSYYNLNFNL